MAISGIYSVVVKTPLGNRQSELSLVEQESNLSGTFTNEKGTAELTNCKVEGNNIEFNVQKDTVVGNINIHIQCTLDQDDNLSGTATLPMGKFPVTGKKKS